MSCPLGIIGCGQPTLGLKLKRVSGEPDLAVTVAASASAGELRACAAAAMRTPAASLRLVHRGRVLADADLLSALKVKAGDAVIVQVTSKEKLAEVADAPPQAPAVVSTGRALGAEAADMAAGGTAAGSLSASLGDLGFVPTALLVFTPLVHESNEA